MLKEDCLGNTKLGKYLKKKKRFALSGGGKTLIEKDLKLGKVQLIQINS